MSEYGSPGKETNNREEHSPLSGGLHNSDTYHAVDRRGKASFPNCFVLLGKDLGV